MAIKTLDVQAPAPAPAQVQTAEQVRVREPDMTTNPKIMSIHGLRVAIGLIKAKIQRAKDMDDLSLDVTTMRVRHHELVVELRHRKYVKDAEAE